MEILANRPYSDGPGGSGQYTHKIYHVGSHIPSWFRALLPKAALQVEEESWNAYPYTRTRWDLVGRDTGLVLGPPVGLSPVPAPPAGTPAPLWRSSPSRSRHITGPMQASRPMSST